MHAAAVALLQWQDTKLPLAVAGYQTACTRRRGCCPAAVAGYQTACACGCPAVVLGYQTASLSKGRVNQGVYIIRWDFDEVFMFHVFTK
jgi:hypothetical protein